MGNESSTLAGRPKVGYHVLKVVEGSPGAQAQLAPFFDFIVAANNHVLDKEDSRLVDILRSNLEHEVDLAVYSTKTEELRHTKLVPSLQWGGNGIVGVSTRFCSLAAAIENVWHVLEVHPNSPAAEAGLQSHLDYIVGTPEVVFSDPEDFFSLVQSHVGMAIQLYVYNLRDDNIRLVTLKPRKDWGGVGCLGCGVGSGLLHRIARDRKSALAQYGISIEDSELGQPKQQQPPRARSETEELFPSLGHSTTAATASAEPTTITVIPTSAPATPAAAPVTAPPISPVVTTQPPSATPAPPAVQVGSPGPTPSPALVSLPSPAEPLSPPPRSAVETTPTATASSPSSLPAPGSGPAPLVTSPTAGVGVAPLSSGGLSSTSFPAPAATTVPASASAVGTTTPSVATTPASPYSVPGAQRPLPFSYPRTPYQPSPLFTGTPAAPGSAGAPTLPSFSPALPGASTTASAASTAASPLARPPYYAASPLRPPLSGGSGYSIPSSLSSPSSTSASAPGTGTTLPSSYMMPPLQTATTAPGATATTPGLASRPPYSPYVPGAYAAASSASGTTPSPYAFPRTYVPRTTTTTAMAPTSLFPTSSAAPSSTSSPSSSTPAAAAEEKSKAA